MKKTIIAALLVVIISTLSGCLATLHPLFTEKDLVFDPRLLGSWKTPDNNDVLVFEKGTSRNFSALPAPMQALADKAYLLTIKEKGNVPETKLYAFLSRIGNSLYLDYYPAENSYQQQYEDFYKQHFIKMHTFERIRFHNDQSFETSQFDHNYLKALIAKKQIRIQHEIRTDGSYVITAPTEELQQYVLKYGDVKEAYENTSTFNKLP
jgi:hypothetical protein